MNPTEIEFSAVRLSNGLNMHYAERGPKDGAPLLMLHGYTDSWYSFSRVLPLLPPHMRVIMPSQRGHGETEKPRSGYSLDQAACDAALLLGELGIVRTMVLGHSMGGFVAQRMAVMHPARVSRLILVNTAARARNNAVGELAQVVETLQDPVNPGFVRDFQTSTFHRPLPQDFVDTVVNESLKVPALLWKWWLRALIRSSLEADLPTIRQPTLVLWGDRDSVFSRADQDLLVQRIPNARLAIFPEVGHSPHWEVPEEFAAEVTAFAARRSEIRRAS